MIRQIATWSKSNRPWLVALLLILATFAVYWQTVTVGFLSDDFEMLTVVAAQHNPFEFFLTNIIGTTAGSSYGPLYTIAMWVEHTLFGLYAPAYHVVHLLLGASVSYVLYLFVRVTTGHASIAVASALLFLILPNHVSAMAWIATLPHVMAALFVLLALWVYWHYMRTRDWRYYALALVAAVGAALSKEVGMVVFPLLFLQEIFWGAEPQHLNTFVVQNTKRFALPVLLVLGYFAMRWYATGQLFGFYASAENGVALSEQFKMLMELVVSMVVAYPTRAVWVQSLLAHPFIVLACVLGFGVGIWFFGKQERRSLYFFALSFLVASLPFLQVSFDPLSNGGQRYAYLVSAFFVPCVVIVIFRITQYIRNARLTFVLSVCMFAAVLLPSTSAQISAWVDGGRLVQDALAQYDPDMIRSHEYVLFVGLPTTLNGVPLFYNATSEAIRLYHDEFFFYKRILIGTKLSAFAGGDMVSVEQTGPLTYTMRKAAPETPLVFSGFPTWSHPYADFTLQDFVTSTNTGSAVTIAVNPQTLAGLHAENRGLAIVYFNEGQFQKITVRAEDRDNE